MQHRVFAAMLGFLLACPPALALAQDDLDDLMASDPDREEEPAEEGEEDEAGGDEGGGDEGGGWDVSGADEERPPGDPTAFALPKEKKKDDEEEDDDDNPTPVSVGVFLGYGVKTEGVANFWGLGLGLQGGYDLGLVNVGLRFGWYIGETYEEVIPDPGIGADQVLDVSVNLWELGLDLGLDIEAGDALIIRPGIGFGLATVSAGDVSDTQPYIAPSLGLIYSLSPTIYLGFEPRYQLVARESGSISGLIFPVLFGMRF